MHYLYVYIYKIYICILNTSIYIIYILKSICNDMDLLDFFCFEGEKYPKQTSKFKKKKKMSSEGKKKKVVARGRPLQWN